jgi:hypothetical protein
MSLANGEHPELLTPGIGRGWRVGGRGWGLGRGTGRVEREKTNNTIARGVVTLVLTDRSEVVGRSEAVTPCGVAADVPPQRVVVKVAAGLELGGVAVPANSCDT